MEALSVKDIPAGKLWQYEPKWDGFRCMAFRNDDRIELQSKSGRSLTRYFPEVVTTITGLKTDNFVFDGEIMVPAGRSFSFDDLLQRIHPASSRVKRLSVETPAIFIVFDLLTVHGKSIQKLPLAERRKHLETFAEKYFRGRSGIRLSPASRRIADAKRWLKRAGGRLDGVIAKRIDLAYQAGNRNGMQKIKNYRSADCVVGGFRYNEGKKVVGSLLLGLYNDEGLLDHVGFTSGLPAAEKPALTAKLEKLVAAPGFTGENPGGPSRWSTKRSAQWQPLRPRLVVEVSYDHFTGGRFRHGTRLLRWRPDKSPRQCRSDQVLQTRGNLMSLLE
jgi:ATP-dependent DNA ligase